MQRAIIISRRLSCWSCKVWYQTTASIAAVLLNCEFASLLLLTAAAMPSFPAAAPSTSSLTEHNNHVTVTQCQCQWPQQSCHTVPESMNTTIMSQSHSASVNAALTDIFPCWPLFTFFVHILSFFTDLSAKVKKS